MLLDTNILIYLTQPGGEKLLAQITSAEPAASLVSRADALGFQSISPVEEVVLNKLFAWVEVCLWEKRWRMPPSSSSASGE